MKSFIRIICAAALSLTSAGTAHAQEAPVGDLSIVAIVNDDIISSLDLDSRIKFVIATTGLSDSPEVGERLKPQLLRTLISERLQVQEAKANGISLPDAELFQAVADIETQRGLPPGMMLKRLDDLGVPRETFVDQIRAQLMWTKLALKKIRPQIKVSEEELDRERRKTLQAGTGSEVQIELLALPVDKPENDAQVKALAEKLQAEIQGGAPFESVARELSGSGATKGENIKPFWVDITQLDPALADMLKDAPPQTMVGPARTPEGYTLVRLLARRNSAREAAAVEEVTLKEILLKLKADATKGDVDLMLDIGKEVAKHPGTCADPGVAGVKDLKDLDIQVNFRRGPVIDLPAALQGVIGKLAIGGVSEPYASDDGIRLFMLCEKLEKPSPLADREETMQRLMQQKLELEAQKYLRNLRRDAFLDIRLKRSPDL